jgi:hypothetical protein
MPSFKTCKPFRASSSCKVSKLTTRHEVEAILQMAEFPANVNMLHPFSTIVEMWQHSPLPLLPVEIWYMTSFNVDLRI